MAEPSNFPQFSQLPAELRLGIWKAAVSSPSMHLFDMCLPAPLPNTNDGNAEEQGRAQVAFYQLEATCGKASPKEAAARYHKFKDTVFFDAHRSSTDSRTKSERGLSTPLHFDPSMYKWKMALESACIDAFVATSLSSLETRAEASMSPTAVFDNAVNTVYLPGPDRRIQYNNRTDVLHLYLSSQQQSTVPAAPSVTTKTPSSYFSNQGCALKLKSSIVEIVDNQEDMDEAGLGLLDVQWSNEMAEALRNARHIALDAAHTSSFVDMSGPLAAEELAMLACTLHQGLEVLYLVDYCPGRCQDCARPELCARDLAQRRGSLYSKLNLVNGDQVNSDDNNDNNKSDADARPPDVIWGVGRIYREVFDLEQLGWSDKHPAFVFAQALGETIRTQQVDATQACQFQGVRVLMAEDE